MKGTINVEQFMDYSARQRRMLEWWYLKQYWRASEEDKPVVLALYGRTLEQALVKHRARHSRQK